MHNANLGGYEEKDYRRDIWGNISLEQVTMVTKEISSSVVKIYQGSRKSHLGKFCMTFGLFDIVGLISAG